MTEPSVQRPDPSATHAPDLRRQLFRLSVRHFLEATKLATDGIDRDISTALTFLAISRANVRPGANEMDRLAAYVAADTIPPDSERRPVSVYAIAKELVIPYETVRRHALKLRSAGLCEAVPGGLIIPNQVFARAEMVATLESYWLATLDFVNAAAAAGIVMPVTDAEPPRDVSRQVMRLGVDFFLETLITSAQIIECEPVAVLILRAVAFANLAHVTLDPERAAIYASLSAPGPSDRERRPVSIYAIAKTLRLPYETARRHAQRLVADGLLRAPPGGGLVYPFEMSTRPEIAAGMALSVDMSLEFLNQLAALGVRPQLPT